MFRVLHIDDEAPIRLLARVNLETQGMEVIEAADGKTGARVAKRGLLERLERGERDELRRERISELHALMGAELDDLVAPGTAIRSRMDFVKFLDALRTDLEMDLARPETEVAWGAGDWTHVDLHGFLEILGAWLRDSRRFDALDAKAWQAFAEMMLAARGHEWASRRE